MALAPVRLIAPLVLAAVAAGNVVRATCWTQTDGFVCGPVATRGIIGRVAPVPVTGLTRFDIPAPDWRPLTIELRVTGDLGAGAVRVSERPDEPGVIVEPGHAVSIVARAAAASPYLLRLWAEPTAGATAPQAVLHVTSLSPVLATGRLLTALLVGAAAGGILVWLAAVRGREAVSLPAAPASAAGGPPSLLVPLVILVVVHGAWVVLKPPFQTPDEPQHHARATSMPDAPYVAGAWTVPLAAAYRNPLTWTPNRLHAIIFEPGERLSRTDVRALRETAWPPAGTYPAVEAVPSGIASYPPLYYWAVFAGGELATRTLGLSPYASVLAYRTASVATAGMLWLFVYALLRRTPGLRPWALPTFITLVATPAAASISSSVNPDALVIPATVLLFLVTWRRLAAGGSDAMVLTGAALVLASKPSGILAVASAAAGALWWMRQQPAERASGWAVLRSLTGASVLAAILFYAWSPPRLSLSTTPVVMTIGDYVLTLAHRAPTLWAEYWGRLGWSEYGAPSAWYWLLLGSCAVLAGMAMRRPVPDGALGGALRGYLLTTAAVYGAGLVIGEYVNVPQASLVLQGRYLLPLGATAILLIRQRSPYLSWLLPVLALALNVVLAQAAIDRYFDGSWSAWWASLA